MINPLSNTYLPTTNQLQNHPTPPGALSDADAKGAVEAIERAIRTRASRISQGLHDRVMVVVEVVVVHDRVTVVVGRGGMLKKTTIFQLVLLSRSFYEL